MVLIKLVIKAPNQKLDDQCVYCDLDWTVAALKSHLADEYPSKPRIEDQRLIYSGHLLKNEQSLRDVLQPIDDNLTFTIHLVCTQRSQDLPKRLNNTNMASNSNNSDVNSTANNSVPEQPSDSSTRNTNANMMNMNEWAASANLVQPFFQMAPMGAVNGVPVMATPEQMFQHMALLQQAYAQYMTQYFGANGVNANVNNVTPSVPAMATQPANPVLAQPQAIPQANAVPPQPQPQPQVQRLNAGPGGAVDDEDDPNNRDWLDWFYWMSRALVLFSILYFYSSFNRFLIVVALSVMLYLYQTGWFNRRPSRRNNDIPNVVNNNDNNVINREIARNEENVNDEVNETPQMEDNDEPENVRQILNADNTSAVRVTEDRLFTGLRFCWVVVSSLFTSLIPDQVAHPVNLN